VAKSTLHNCLLIQPQKLPITVDTSW